MIKLANQKLSIKSNLGKIEKINLKLIITNKSGFK